MTLQLLLFSQRVRSVVASAVATAVVYDVVVAANLTYRLRVAFVPADVVVVVAVVVVAAVVLLL